MGKPFGFSTTLLLADFEGMNRLLETYPGLLDDPRVASRYARMKP